MIKNRILALCLAATLGLAACTGNTASSTGAADASGVSTESSAASQEAKKAGKVKNLIIGTTAENNVFNVHSQKDAFGRLNYNGLTQGNFVYIDKNNQPQPYFFKSFEISEDGKVLEFTFPTDAVWHDGKPVTDEDILFTFDYMKNVKKVGTLENLESWEITGEGSAKLVFSEPDVYYWLNSSAMNNACVFPKHIWEGVTDYEEYSGEDSHIGCGPYKLVSKDKDSQTSYYEMVPENNYAGEHTVEAVTIQSYADEQTLMMAMVNGEIDAMFNYANPIDANIIDSIAGTEHLDRGESNYAGQFQITYGMERQPASDIEFRRAARLAFDYAQLASVINGKYGVAPGEGIITPSCKGFDASLPKLERNLDEAKKILDAAGYVDKDGDGFREYPDGSSMDVMITPQFTKKDKELFDRISETLMASLKDVGIKTHMDQESMSNQEVWEKNITDGKYDISIGYTTSGMAAYSSAFRYFLADPRFEGEKTWIWGTYHNDEFKDTFFKMQQAINEDEYVSNVKKLQQMASKEVFAQALCWEKAFFPYRTDKYQGWDNYPSWGVIHSRTWFELTAKP